MRHILILLSLISMESAFGQTTSIKVYQNTDIFSVTYYVYQQNQSVDETYKNYNRFTVAINIPVKHKLAHELEIFVPEISKSIYNVQFPLDYHFKKDDAFNSSISTYSFRYEINKIINDPAKRLTFNVGIGINPYYVAIEYKSNSKTWFDSWVKYYGASFNVIPRINLRISKRFSADLNFPVKIYELRQVRQHVDNPAIPIAQQNNEEWNNEFFVKAYSVRLGIMYKFKNKTKD